MKYSPDHIQKFQSIYKEHFGEELSDQDAYEQLRAVVVITELGLMPRPPNTE